jgi:hypothetical protein
LTGDRKVELPFEIGFKKDVEFKEVCVKVRGTAWLAGPPPPSPLHPLASPFSSPHSHPTPLVYDSPARRSV